VPVQRLLFKKTLLVNAQHTKKLNKISANVLMRLSLKMENVLAKKVFTLKNKTNVHNVHHFAMDVQMDRFQDVKNILLYFILSL
jgi:hypothetical protein